MGESFQITVLGQRYLLKGTHDKEYVERVEKFLNDKIEQARSSGATADTFNLMVLVALNLADDCIKKDDELKKIMAEQQKLAEEFKQAANSAQSNINAGLESINKNAPMDDLIDFADDKTAESTQQGTASQAPSALTEDKKSNKQQSE